MAAPVATSTRTCRGSTGSAPLLAHGARTPDDADVAVIEGVMGLFDGAVGTGGFASSAHVAELVQAPVVLVVDCAATARSVGAIVHGFSRFSDRIRVTGVILNNVASSRHEAEARDGVAETGVPVLGVIPRLPDVVVPSRHLGLVPAAERRPEATAAVEALGRMATEHIDLDAVLEVARRAPDLGRHPVAPGHGAAAATSPPGTVPGSGSPVARPSASATPRPPSCWPRPVPRSSPFDPVHDARLPEGLSGLVIGGGFPEVHAAVLAANAGMRRSVAQLAADGGAIAAECAGLLYLGEELDGQPMCGVLPVTAALGPRLTLGYRTAVALTDSVLARTGERVTGHEFHRTVTTVGDGTAAWGWRDNAGHPTTEGLVLRRIHASYLHVHWAGHPHLAARFVGCAAEVGR